MAEQARLRDIQDLFIGTGLGPESYAIIEQGRIGQILSNKPQDRRAIIEEAAGIGKFKTKKRLAEAKLEGAKQNLSRVFDILEEVGRQVNSLKRQASKARRYEELKAEMIAQLRRALTGRYRMLEREAAKTALDLNLANAEFQNLSNQVAERETRAHRAPGDLLSQRRRADQRAPATGRFATRTGAHARQARIAGQADRRHRAAPRTGRSRNAGIGETAVAASAGAGKTLGFVCRARTANRVRARAADRKDRRARTRSSNPCRNGRKLLKPAAKTCCGCWAKPRR